MNWLAPFLAYLAVAVGLFQFHSAWGALVGFHFAIILSLLIAKPELPLQILFKNSNTKWILVSVLIGASSGITLYFLWDGFGFASDLPAQVRALGLNTSGWLPFIAYFALVNPLVEEYFWRGFLGSNAAHFTVSDFLYSGFHGMILVNKVQTGMLIYGLAVLVVAGWFWRQVARLDRGLLATVLGHMAADLSILLAIYWKVSQ